MEPLFREFEALNPVACEIAPLSEFLAKELEKVGRKEEANALRARAKAAYEECGSMPERHLMAVLLLGEPDLKVKGRELAEFGMRGWGIGESAWDIILTKVLKSDHDP
jgi:hypothetical protein